MAQTSQLPTIRSTIASHPLQPRLQNHHARSRRTNRTLPLLRNLHQAERQIDVFEHYAIPFLPAVLIFVNGVQKDMHVGTNLSGLVTMAQKYFAGTDVSKMAQSSAVIAENAVFQRIPTSKYVVFKKGVHDYMFDYFKIKTVPTVMFFKRGDIVGAHEGGNVKEFEKAILSQFAEALAPTHYCKGDYPDWCNTREYCAAWDLNAVEKGGPLDPKINRK
ncbi:hypothetical protein M7I_1159 [Glarea lozoyensis 74030]|uniref:Thioredoxin-like protein n=1 Tax=Glarea lozoyensis (strain ATCC 74030 / MF5533) TaxID=1104152 RepID=H0EFN0_GLAL7|nr:hypothetical protein M7I_1159 [Glarea lozoyensis 74030]